MSLADHLNTMGLRRELAELLANTDGLIRTLARSDEGDVRAQADLAVMIDLHRVFERYLESAIELQEMGNVQGSRNAEVPDRWERRRTLEAAVKEWEDSLERWKQEYRAVTERLERWEDAKNATNVQTEVRTPETWRGSERELAAHIIELYEKGEIGRNGQSKRQAFLQNADRFIVIDKNGGQKRVKPESLWRNYYQQFH